MLDFHRSDSLWIAHTCGLLLAKSLRVQTGTTSKQCPIEFFQGGFSLDSSHTQKDPLFYFCSGSKSGRCSRNQAVSNASIMLERGLVCSFARVSTASISSGGNLRPTNSLGILYFRIKASETKKKRLTRMLNNSIIIEKTS